MSIQDGEDGNPPGKDTEGEPAESEEIVEPTPEEKKKLKEKEEKEKKEAELRSTIEKEILAKQEKEKIAAELKKKDEKEKVSEEMKTLADTLRIDLGEDYPEAFNRMKIAGRISAMIALKTALDKRDSTAPIQKGKSGIPKPKPKGGAAPKDTQFTASTSMKERAKSFSWTRKREK